MVLLWSVESMQSEQVINELTLADRSGVMILPFRVDDVEPEGAFKYYLYKTHWLDAFDGWKQKPGIAVSGDADHQGSGARVLQQSLGQQKRLSRIHAAASSAVQGK
ncbi:hypothetical protein [Synechococcus sp. 8F6]|nr:hypothetical protein [Synechococcus sp. 8F6]